MNRRKSLVALASVLAAPLVSFAQQQGKVWRVGFLGAGRAPAYAHRIDALRGGLRDYGYVEGKNLAMEFRWAEGNYERLPQLAIELVRLNIDALVTHTTPGTRAARHASATLPIVMTDVVDAVGVGLVDSLARPGGNITGSSFMGPQLFAKRLEMLKEVLPAIRRVGLLVNPNNPSFAAIRKEITTAAKISKVELQEFEARQFGEIEAAFQAMPRGRVDAVMVQEDPLFTVNTGKIASLAINYRLPLAGFSEFADTGGLIGYGANFTELYRRAAYFVDKILKGAKPADLPVEQPTKFELVINMKTAKTLGLTIPQSILVRADRVIE